jgi:hypothetical protein
MYFQFRPMKLSEPTAPCTPASAALSYQSAASIQSLFVHQPISLKNANLSNALAIPWDASDRYIETAEQSRERELPEHSVGSGEAFEPSDRRITIAIPTMLLTSETFLVPAQPM